MTTRQRHVANADLRLRRVGTVDDDDTARRRRWILGLHSGKREALPGSERPLSAGERLFRGHVANNRKNRVVGAKPSRMEREEIVARDGGNRFRGTRVGFAIRVE